jgi:integrase
LTALACTGLRISELASLRWADINLTNLKIILTDETAHGNEHGIGQRQLKSGRSRSFPIHHDLATVFTRMARKNAFVFHGPRGGRLKPDTVRNVLVSKVLNEMASQFPSPEGAKGFVDGRLHSFRHFFCSFCANNDVSEFMIMEWLGHQERTMVKHYYHLGDRESQRKMSGLDFLGSASKQVQAEP